MTGPEPLSGRREFFRMFFPTKPVAAAPRPEGDILQPFRVMTVTRREFGWTAVVLVAMLKAVSLPALFSAAPACSDTGKMVGVTGEKGVEELASHTFPAEIFNPAVPGQGDSVIEETVEIGPDYPFVAGENKLTFKVKVPEGKVIGPKARVKETGQYVYLDYRDVKKDQGVSTQGGFGLVGLSSRFFVVHDPLDPSAPGVKVELWSMVLGGKTYYGIPKPGSCCNDFLWVDPDSGKYISAKEDAMGRIDESSKKLTDDPSEAYVWLGNWSSVGDPRNWEQALMFAKVKQDDDGTYSFVAGADGKKEFIPASLNPENQLYAYVAAEVDLSVAKGSSVPVRIDEILVELPDGRKFAFIPLGGQRVDPYTGDQGAEVAERPIDYSATFGTIRVDLTEFLDNGAFAGRIRTFYSGAPAEEYVVFETSSQLVVG